MAGKGQKRRRIGNRKGIKITHPQGWKPCWQEVYRVDMFGAELELRTWREEWSRIEAHDSYGHGSSGVQSLRFRN